MTAPKMDLKTLMAISRAQPRSVELELALQDFLELPDAEQMEVLFVGLCQVSACMNWAMETLKRIGERP